MSSCICRLPAQRQFSIPQRKEGGHWNDFELVRQQLQPFLRPVTPHPHSLPASTTTLLQYSQGPSTGNNSEASREQCQTAGLQAVGSVHRGVHASSTAVMNGAAAQRNRPIAVPSNIFTPLDGETAEDGQKCNFQHDDSSEADVVSQASGARGQHRMPTQQELTAAGRMDLLNAVRVWGGFTAVADLMGVLPNTRFPHLAST